MIAVKKFMVYVDGKETVFRAGDKIPAAIVKECDLANKPKLAKAAKAKKTEE